MSKHSLYLALFALRSKGRISRAAFLKACARLDEIKERER